jgi:peptidyl-prolyl cis-trans isomerase A (cyclophilin A)
MNPVVYVETSLGRIKMEVYEDRAPVTARNFLRYMDAGLFDGTTFFRTVTPDNQPNDAVKIEVIQGGMVPEERRFPPIDHETTEATGLRHLDGTVSMARFKPGSAASSFFICIGDQPELDCGGRRNPDLQGFAAFGAVLEGMDVVRLIQTQPREGQRLTPPIEIKYVRRLREGGGAEAETDLVAIFRRLKAILKEYEGELRPKVDLDSKYDLWSFKEVVVEGRRKREVYFAGLIIQSRYVGLYYMPVYTDAGLKDVFRPRLLKLLKGKSCFHVKTLDAELEAQIREALDTGYRLYKERGWI